VYLCEDVLIPLCKIGSMGIDKCVAPQRSYVVMDIHSGVESDAKRPLHGYE
jgi:hypothetical protein